MSNTKPSRNHSFWRNNGLGFLALLSCLNIGLSQENKSLFQSTYGKIHFISDAPLESIEASSESLNGLIDVEKRTFAFSIPMNSFQGFNSSLQREHYNEKYLETDEFPRAQFSGKIIEKIDFDTSSAQELRAKGILEIHGLAQERIIKGILYVKKNTLEIKVDFIVPLSDHNIQIPKVVYQKIAEHIKVHVDIVMENK